MKYKIIAVGGVKKTPYKDLCAQYLNRLNTKTELIEIEVKTKDPHAQYLQENQKIEEQISSNAYVIALDKDGKAMSSPALATLLDKQRLHSARNLCFIIGGSEGLSPQVKSAADILISFGQATWPHMLARVMLLEQLYRAQQISAGHPYHK